MDDHLAWSWFLAITIMIIATASLKHTSQHTVHNYLTCLMQVGFSYMCIVNNFCLVWSCCLYGPVATACCLISLDKNVRSNAAPLLSDLFSQPLASYRVINTKGDEVDGGTTHKRIHKHNYMHTKLLHQNYFMQRYIITTNMAT